MQALINYYVIFGSHEYLLPHNTLNGISFQHFFLFSTISKISVFHTVSSAVLDDTDCCFSLVFIQWCLMMHVCNIEIKVCAPTEFYIHHELKRSFTERSFQKGNEMTNNTRGNTMFNNYSYIIA